MLTLSAARTDLFLFFLALFLHLTLQQLLFHHMLNTGGLNFTFNHCDMEEIYWLKMFVQNLCHHVFDATSYGLVGSGCQQGIKLDVKCWNVFVVKRWCGRWCFLKCSIFLLSIMVSKPWNYILQNCISKERSRNLVLISSAVLAFYSAI